MVPSYKGLKPASEASSRVKRNNRSSDTLHEVLLRRELWRGGLRFRKNVASLPGKPDIVFSGAKVLVFCDGDFWHGRKWQTLEGKLDAGTNGKYWSAKIAANIERDRRNTLLLEDAGWQVVRLWETDIKKDVAAAAAIVRDVIETRRQSGKLKQKHDLGAR